MNTPSLARVAELERELTNSSARVGTFIGKLKQAEQRVAELEQYRAGDAEALSQLRIRVEHAEAEAKAQRTQRMLAENTNAKLVAALLDAANALESDDGEEQEASWGRIRDLNLHSAESATPAHCADCDPSFGCWQTGIPCRKQVCTLWPQTATPAKHPDTERLEFAFAHDMIVNRGMQSWIKTREQFDAQKIEWLGAARKQGGIS